MNIRRISEILITSKNKNHKMMNDLSFKIAHVKNMMNYIIRSQFFDNEIYNEFLEEVIGTKETDEYKKNRKFLNIGFIEKEIAEIPKLFKDEKGKEQINYYHDLPKNMVQQIRRQLTATWKGYFKTIKKNAQDKNGKKVGLPGYSKNHRSTVIISDNDFSVYYYKNYKDYLKKKRIKLKDIHTLSDKAKSKVRTELVISPRKNNSGVLLEKGIYFVQEVKIIPNSDNSFVIHINYFQDKQSLHQQGDQLNEIQKKRKHIKEKTIKKDKIIAGIDCGVRNLITMSVVNKDTKEILKTYQIKKKEYKEIENIDKEMEELKSKKDNILEEKYQELKQSEPIKGQKPHGWKQKTLDELQKDQLTYDQYQELEKSINNLWARRERVVKNTVHSISSKIAQICNHHKVSKLVFGKNKEMKQEMEGKIWNQFPHSKMMNLLKYKLEDIDCELIEQEESYTSKASYFDLEPFEHGYKFQGTRKNESFYRPKGNKIKKYDADVNGSLNIIRKYILKTGASYIMPVGEQRIPLSKQFFVHCSLTH